MHESVCTCKYVCAFVQVCDVHASVHYVHARACAYVCTCKGVCCVNMHTCICILFVDIYIFVCVFVSVCVCIVNVCEYTQHLEDLTRSRLVTVHK